VSAAIDDQPDRPAEAAVRAIPASTIWWWSIRREIWENRSIVIAPLIVAVLVYLGFVVHAFHQADLQRAGADVLDGGSIIASPAHLIALLVIATATLVGVFYCTDALHAERSDRSILFWKSLPVSDRMVVLAKASIPLVVLPAYAYLVIVVAQFVMFASVAAINGAAATGPIGPLFRLMGTVLYALVVTSAWYAPVYAWLMFVSGWARRMVLVTALLPLLLVALVERIALGTTWFGHLLKVRIFGFGPDGFVNVGHGDVLPNPAGLWSSPSLWLGLVVAGLLFGASAWMRRRAAPL